MAKSGRIIKGLRQEVAEMQEVINGLSESKSVMCTFDVKGQSIEACFTKDELLRLANEVLEVAITI